MKLQKHEQMLRLTVLKMYYEKMNENYPCEDFARHIRELEYYLIPKNQVGVKLNIIIEQTEQRLRSFGINL